MWFTRTQLRNRFELNTVNKKIYTFRKVAEQKPLKSHSLKYDSDDENSENDDHNKKNKKKNIKEEKYEKKKEEQIKTESEVSEVSEESDAELNNAENTESVRELKISSNQVWAFEAQKGMLKLQISSREKVINVKKTLKSKRVSKLKMKETKKVIRTNSKRINLFRDWRYQTDYRVRALRV